MRSRSSLIVPAAFCLAALSLTDTARAQVVTFSHSGAGGAVTRVGTVSIADDVLRAMLASHESDALQPNAENNYIVLVIDANDQYVTSRASKMKVMTAGEGDHTFAVGDSGTARVIVRTSSGEAPTVGATTGSVIIARTGEHDDDSHGNGVMGTGFNMSDVAGISMKRYAAGEFAPGQLMVSVIKLK